MILLQLALALAAALLGPPSSVRCPPGWWASAPTWPTPRVVCAWSREDGSGRVELWVPLRCRRGEAGVVVRERLVVCRRRNG